MEWNKEMHEALRAWLSPSTAHKQHPLDDARFYQFVAQAWRTHQGIWDESLVRERMRAAARELHPDWSESLIEETVETRRQQGTLILDFLTSLREHGKVNTLIQE